MLRLTAKINQRVITRIYFEFRFYLDHKYRTFTDTTASPPLFAHIVTTNYDRVIENFYEDVYGKPPRIGFIVDEKTQERYLDTEGMISGKYQASNTWIEYLKAARIYRLVD